MNLPSLPTDNLYKFVALTGLALLALSLTFPVSKIIELQMAVTESQALRAKLDIQDDTVERALQKLEKSISPSAGEVASVRELHEQRKLMQIELDKTSKLNTYQLEWIQLYRSASIIGLILGSVLATLGFRFWYIRVQRPLDQRMIHETSKGA
jgi:biopolymer transport protein ExbB/TolQ